MAKIFISHRRNDRGYAARGINDALVKRFGKRKVFFDLDSILAGQDWRQQLEKMVEDCDVMLAIIGDEWLQKDESGQSRLMEKDDPVGFEVASALNRNIPVIPVLVGNAAIPDKESLPEVVRPLHFRQAVEVRDDANFNAHMENLLTSIEAVAPAGSSHLWKWALGVSLILIVAVAGGLALNSFDNQPTEDPDPIKMVAKYALTINPEPADAKIRFLSTGQEYQPGVMLVPGRYHVEVSREGFVTQTQWLEIESRDVNLDLVLETEKPVVGREF